MILTQDGMVVCALCGVQVDATADDRPIVMIKASSGEPNTRVVMLGHKEIHACPMTPETPLPTQ
jgi:hypothetical protein